jgi:hypothetical protein
MYDHFATVGRPTIAINFPARTISYALQPAELNISLGTRPSLVRTSDESTWWLSVMKVDSVLKMPEQVTQRKALHITGVQTQRVT